MIGLQNSVIAFIGSAGIPGRYGGFETFLESCGPYISEKVKSLSVTCDASIYKDKSSLYNGMQRSFIGIRANGYLSVLHDLIAFMHVFPKSTHIIVLGVSGGPWFPIFRLLCDLSGKILLVNIDGVEWRRDKFGYLKKKILKIFDWMAQKYSHIVIYDNAGLKKYLIPDALCKSVEIPYSGDHVLRSSNAKVEIGSALTICRIEPENQIELLINGALASTIKKYTIVGNWNNSEYGSAIRDKYKNENRLILLDPIYDQERLSDLRDCCQIYLHGHSVGGTNPSLVEMLFYDSHILCFDVSYNRYTSGPCAQYFSDISSLAKMIDCIADSVAENRFAERRELRLKYTRQAISEAYLNLFMPKIKH